MSETPRTLDLSFLRDRKAQKRVAVVTAAFAVVGLLYALLAPKWYRSTLTVVPAKSQKGGLSSMLSGELGGIAAGLADGAVGGGADVQRIAAVLQSNDVSDAVIAKFDLKRRYGEKYQEAARTALWGHCDVKALPKPGLVQLSCEDKDPRFAQELLQYFSEYGNQVFRRVGVSSASEQVRFLEKRVGELRVQADETAQRMQEFQEKHQIVDLETQTKAVVSAMAALQSQRISKQLELDYARTFSSGDEATLQQLQSQLSVMDTKLQDMEDPGAVATRSRRKPRPDATANGGMFPAALSVPKLRAEFETLYRDRKVAEATLIFALERLEGARADEARDTSTFLVLDPPALPTRHTRPKKTSILLVAMLLGLLGAVASEWWQAGGLRALAAAPPTEREAA
jgi:capsule polysaccharide export protein KpsE/RkpR